MSSRVGTAMPASFSTALSSAHVGLKRSIQTAPSGSLARSLAETFFREDSEGTNTESMGHSGRHFVTHQQLPRFWQVSDDGIVNYRFAFVASAGPQVGMDLAIRAGLPKNQPKTDPLAAKKT